MDPLAILKYLRTKFHHSEMDSWTSHFWHTQVIESKIRNERSAANRNHHEPDLVKRQSQVTPKAPL